MLFLPTMLAGKPVATQLGLNYEALLREKIAPNHFGVTRHSCRFPLRVRAFPGYRFSPVTLLTKVNPLMTFAPQSENCFVRLQRVSNESLPIAPA